MRKIQSFSDELVALIKSGHQVINVTTVEEKRLLEDIQHAATHALPKDGGAPWRVITWDCVNGFSDTEDPKLKSVGDLVTAFNFLPTPEEEESQGQPVKGRFDVPGGLNPFLSPKPGKVTGVHSVKNIDLIVLDNDIKHPVVLPPFVGPVVKIGDSVVLGQTVGMPKTRDAIFVFKDITLVLNNDGAGMNERRALRNIIEEQLLSNFNYSRPVIFTGATPLNHPDMAASVTHITYNLPTVEELGQTVDYISDAIGTDAGSISPDFRKRIVDAMRGLSRTEAENTLALISWASEGFHYGDKQAEEEEALIAEIYKRKREKWVNEGSIELVDSMTLETFDEIGGYDEFKKWIEELKYSLTDHARKMGAPELKGTVLGGLPGTGKSVIATIVAKELGLPLVELKFDAMFGSLLGESEMRMRNALAKIKALGPCVLRVDEADKAMGGLKGDFQGDGGVSKRLLGTFLSWQANVNRDAFVVMTLNNLDALSPEQVRTGRFDMVWFVDLPTDVEREEILKIHLRKNKYDVNILTASEYTSVISALKGASGSDIENVVKRAMRKALAASRGENMDLNYEVLISCARSIKTASATAGNTFEKVREMFDGRAYPVSSHSGIASVDKPRKPQRSITLKN